MSPKTIPGFLLLAVLTLNPAPTVASSLFLSKGAGTVEEYDAGTGAFITSHSTGSGFQTAVGLAIGPDGNLYIANQDTPSVPGVSSILKLDLSSGVLTTFSTGGIDGIFNITFGPNGNLFATSAAANTTDKVVQFDGTSGALIGDFVTKPFGESPSAGIVFGPNGNLYVGKPSAVWEYDGITGDFIRILISDASIPILNGLLFTPTENIIVANSGLSPTIREYDGSTGAFIKTFDAHSLPGVGFNPVTVAIGPNGELFASNNSTGSDPAIFHYDLNSGAFLGTFTSATGHGSGLVFAASPEPIPALSVRGSLIALLLLFVGAAVAGLSRRRSRRVASA